MSEEPDCTCTDPAAAHWLLEPTSCTNPECNCQRYVPALPDMGYHGPERTPMDPLVECVLLVAVCALLVLVVVLWILKWTQGV